MAFSFTFFFLSFDLRASIVLDFLWIILMSERISGEARIATSFKKTTHNDLTVFALLVSVSAGLHFMGIRN
jgi:membrane-anchored protein YejM (alkaline phosphatase superfamily)